MAQDATLDSYDDLDELGTDIDELTEEFLKSATHLKTLISQLDDLTLLNFYGYYKQATEGPCHTCRPSWYNVKARSKWDAWMKLGKMNQNEAKKLYIDLIKTVDSNFKNVTNKESWVSVSTLQSNEKVINDSEKSIFDYVKEGNREQVEYMLQSNKLDECWNGLDENGIGLIHWAADRGYSEIIQVLLSHGANVNLRDVEMQTPLHYAVICSHSECVCVLLQNNADISLKDNDGLSPKDVAVDENIKELLS